MPFPWLAAAQIATPFLAQGLNMISGSAGANKQYHANKKLAAFQHAQNMELLKYQLAYNSPAAQRKRMEEAGYNPNMFYGTGTSGNMESAPRYPDIQAPDIQSVYADLGTRLQQSRLLGAQADLTEQKSNESGVKQSLMKQQTAVLAANPYLDKKYLQSVVTLMESTAAIKQNERNVLLESQPSGYSIGQEKILKELDLLNQRYNLGSKDLSIKAEIFKSKQFQNDLQRIQVEWMKDGSITPQHIYMGIMLLLQKLM